MTENMSELISRYRQKYNDLIATLLQSLAQPYHENIVVSPFSVLMLLTMAADSVGGDTRKEILNAVGAGLSYEEFREMGSGMQKLFSGIASSNAVCVQEKIAKTISTGYEAKLEDYQGELFASGDIVNRVNSWVKEKTNGMISNVADESLKEMQACLINAIAFEAEWQDEYEEDDIYDRNFTNRDTSVSKVQMMDSVEYGYIENDYFTGFVKPYRRTGCSFMALLPRKKGASFLERALKKLNLYETFYSSNRRKVYVTMPEFKCDFGKDLREFCKSIGIETIFSDEADFSPMSSEWLKLDSVIHKAHIEVDRMGTKAAAVSMGVVEAGCAAMIDDTKSVCLDRPFVYAVMNNRTQLPVFTGIVNQL